jgi:hypothetical protein
LPPLDVKIPGPAELAEKRELKVRDRLLERENEILRRAAAHLARDISPLVTDLAADGVPVAVTGSVLGFSKQGNYRNPVTYGTESMRIWSTRRGTSMQMIRNSGTGSSPTNSRRKASCRARTGYNACAGTTASGRCSPRSVA